MKSFITATALAVSVSLYGISPTNAAPFNDVSQYVSSRTATNGDGTARFDTATYNARFGKAKTTGPTGFNDRNGDFVKQVSTERRGTVNIRRNCNRVVPRGFNEGNAAVNPVC